MFGKYFEILFDGSVMLVDTTGFQSPVLVEADVGHIDVPASAISTKDHRHGIVAAPVLVGYGIRCDAYAMTGEHPLDEPFRPLLQFSSALLQLPVVPDILLIIVRVISAHIGSYGCLRRAVVVHFPALDKKAAQQLGLRRVSGTSQIYTATDIVLVIDMRIAGRLLF